jgi:putative endonuclease
LDIVATTPDENTLVFVEVKTRRDTVFAQPEQAVDRNKRHSLTLAANAYLRRYEVNKNIRFDIITVVGTNDNDVHIEHFENAFQPPSI